MKIARKILRQCSMFLAFLALIVTALVADAAETPAPFEKVRAFRDGDVFSAEFQTTAPWSGTDVQVVYEDDGIKAEISGAFLNKGKQLVRFDDRAFRSFQATQLDATTVRAKFYTKKGISGKSFDSRFRARRSAGNVIFEVVGDPSDAAVAKTVTDEVRNVVVNDDESAAPESMAATLVAGATTSGSTTATKTSNDNAEDRDASATAASNAGSVGDAAAAAATIATAPAKKLDTSKLSEDQIPVLTTAKEAKKAEGNGFFRILMTLGVLAVGLGAATFGLKRWSSKNGNKNQKNTRIKVLTSHHLGPKKNLMIVQVAGETLLIGVTDQNISMLKTLSLLDEEIPESVPQRFDQSMDDFMDHDEDEPIAMRGLNDIRDTVSTRLKNMRNL